MPGRRLSENEIYCGKPMWRNYEKTAQAVIIAMREPSLRMLTIPGFDWKVATVISHAMIDAATD